MQNKLIIVGICLLLTACFQSQEDKNEERLIETIAKCIESEAFPEKTVGVYKKRENYDGYSLFIITKFYGITDEEAYPYKISKIKDKYIFFFSRSEKPLCEEYVDKIIEETGEIEGSSKAQFYYAQCKTSDKSLLVRTINNNIKPYDIPEIREFNC